VKHPRLLPGVVLGKDDSFCRVCHSGWDGNCLQSDMAHENYHELSGSFVSRRYSACCPRSKAWPYLGSAMRFCMVRGIQAVRSFHPVHVEARVELYERSGCSEGMLTRFGLKQGLGRRDCAFRSLNSSTGGKTHVRLKCATDHMHESSIMTRTPPTEWRLAQAAQ